MVVGGNLNSPLNLFISFAKALMEQGFPSDPFLAKDRYDTAHDVLDIAAISDGHVSLGHNSG
jgi:hypothetical protein